MCGFDLSLSSTAPRGLRLGAFDLAVALLDDSASALLISRWLSSTARRRRKAQTDQETCLEGLSRGLHLATSSNCKTGNPFIFDLLDRLKVLKCDCAEECSSVLTEKLSVMKSQWRKFSLL
ncbi:BnaC05g47360D [Brassica napus]|uniref:BnaC05g47360D protein n=1 Tax=Brassica napus TaxID=3708 RepID=A0A078HWT3_BRANA|nr:BnaC05g47360D [Brassica napus]